MKTAQIILEQLGGGRFAAMTGSKNFISDGNTLRMTLARNKSKANRLYITLDPDDTYRMRFIRYSAPRLNTKTMTFTEGKTTEIKEYTGVYCDMLESLFSKVTGLYTRL